MKVKNFAVVVSVVKSEGNPVSHHVISTLDFIPAISEKEAIGIAYDWAMKAYPQEQGYGKYLIHAKQCPE